MSIRELWHPANAMPTAATASKLTFKVPITSVLHLPIPIRNVISFRSNNLDTMAILTKFSTRASKKQPISRRFAGKFRQKTTGMTISSHLSHRPCRMVSGIQSFQGEQNHRAGAE
ncbi:MAG: hypothetical protein ACRECY_01985 [Phyllobacterium sp.]